tara:strand:- start:1241 stop:1696 length:456 start_codon:yes stop_codon:yes gene_type:complete
VSVLIKKHTQMGYNTDWNGGLTLSRELTPKEQKEWNAIIENRHDSEYFEGDERREFPSIWCDFEIDGKEFRWNGNEKTYEGIGWIKFFLNKLKEWNKTEKIYAEGELEWRGDDGDEDMGRVVVIGMEVGGKHTIHIDNVVFDYERDKTYYI